MTGPTAVPGARITELGTATLSLPLSRPLPLGAMTVTRREYVAARVRDDNGNDGISYALTREAPMAAIVERLLAQHVVGHELDVLSLWESMFRGSAIVGRVGLVRRAIGLVDIALWDLLGRRTGEPVWRLLGADNAPRATMLVAAYPTLGRTVDDLVDEVVSQAAAGWPLVKISRSPDTSLMRELLAELNRELPDRTGLVVDVGFGWRDADQALAEVAEWGDPQLAWLEDPLLPEDVDGCARIRSGTGLTLAVGDEVTDPAVLKALVEGGGIDLARLDVVALGGITPAIDFVHWAAERGVPISCHVSPETSVHLGAVGVETFGRAAGGNPYDPSPTLVTGGPLFDAGHARPTSEPGLGFGFAADTFDFGRNT
ncbi:mandelate racemase/muconate lactonizing enzyme family protein [Diaminobutyricibacter sp. McL0608]|uniref:mandelate racemase/muconate lactonizing enzyme family protein n=1 Tax=Leifsonia sp. McL0608 TaxID=3143537 RepID=UPI0031F31F9C